MPASVKPLADGSFEAEVQQPFAQTVFLPAKEKGKTWDFAAEASASP